jgi:threonine dehydrogenase-like Zn-dependent dehydrogenase
MRGAVLYGPRDVRFEERDEPTIIDPTDAIIRLSATCVCGSDLWPYRGIDAPTQPTPMGHEYCGIVEEVGRAVTSITPGRFVVGSFFASDNTCPICQAGYQSRCVQSEYVGAGGAQAPRLRVPLADGTLVATPDIPSDDLIPGLLATSDVLGTGWFGADAAHVQPGKTVAVVGDGAVGLCAVIAAKQMGAERIIAMSRHETRQQLARAFGATDIVSERGEEGIARVRDLTNGFGTHAVLECVGTDQAMATAVGIARAGGAIGRVGVPHYDVVPAAQPLFYKNIIVGGGPAPVRAYIEELLPDVLAGRIEPGRVFDRMVGLDGVPEGYRAMDSRESIKVMVQP